MMLAKPNPAVTPALELFFERRTIPEPMSGCHLWIGPTNRDGYGVVVCRGRHYMAHRIALLIEGAAVPRDRLVDHVCRVKPCVNPAHLRVVDARQNALENSSSAAALNAAKQQCPNCRQSYTMRKCDGGRVCELCIMRRRMDPAYRKGQIEQQRTRLAAMPSEARRAYYHRKNQRYWAGLTREEKRALQKRAREHRNAWERTRYASDAEYREKRRAAKRERYASDPAYRERCRAVMCARRARLRATRGE